MLTNKKNCYDGLKFMDLLIAAKTPFAACFFDPQYRGVLDYTEYGNEGKSRMVERASLQSMSEPTIIEFIKKISLLLSPQGYMFLWMDKFHLVKGDVQGWLPPTMQTVDMVTWNKGLMGMGSRLRNCSEFLIVCQKKPIAATNWKIKNIRDVWEEKIPNPRTKGLHPHRKPVGLMTILTQACTQPGDNILDPAAGSFVTLDVCQRTNRVFWGCDIDPKFCEPEKEGTK